MSSIHSMTGFGRAAKSSEAGGFVMEVKSVNHRFLDARVYLPSVAAELVDASGALRSWPHLHGCDGFFAVRLRRR